MDFEIDKDELEFALELYRGCTIKCITAPYHTKSQVEELLKGGSKYDIFPEHSLSYKDTYEYIAKKIESGAKEINIITASLIIISDITHGCVRILNKDGELVKPEIKPDKEGVSLAGNLFNINRGCLDSQMTIGGYVADILRKNFKLIEKKEMSEEEFQWCENVNKRVGDEIIKFQVTNMLKDIKVK